MEPHYFAPSSTEEIDLILQDGMDVIPGEIKAGESIRSNAFHKFIKKHDCKRAICYSGLNYQKNDVLYNIPLYLVGKTGELLKETNGQT